MRRRALALLAPLLVIFGAIVMYGDWETPYDRRTPSDDEHDDVASFRASPLPSNPAALPVLVQRDIEQLVETDVPTPSKRELATLRTERRVTLLRAYAVLRYADAGPLLEDVVDTATDERVRAEAVTMLGYVGYPSWRLLDELVDARDAGRDLERHLLALRFFFGATDHAPPWIRTVVRELLEIAESSPRVEDRRSAAITISRAIRTDLDSDWIDEIGRLAASPDARCRATAVNALRGASVVRNPIAAFEILSRALASSVEVEAAAATARFSSPTFRAAVGLRLLYTAAPSLVHISCDDSVNRNLRLSAIRALRFIGDRESLSVVEQESPDLRGEAAAQLLRIGATEPEPADPPRHEPAAGLLLRTMIQKILEDRSNTSKSSADVVQGRRRAYAVDPLRRIAREIRREVLK